jgi:hypothetical protein
MPKIEPPCEVVFKVENNRDIYITPVNSWINSTRYTISLPAGTASLLGDSFKKEKRLEFTTPLQRFEQLIPQYGPMSNYYPLLAASFSQVIDPEKILKVIKLSWKGGLFSRTESAVRLATDEEINKNPEVKRLLTEKEGRAVAFVPIKELPPSSQVKIHIGPKLCSEGSSVLHSLKNNKNFNTEICCLFSMNRRTIAVRTQY